MPGNKETAKKFIEHGYKTQKILVYDIQPVAIKVHGNFAFVHYHYQSISKDAEGKEQDVYGRWTDILLKQGDKWLLIGDHGGRTSKN